MTGAGAGCVITFGAGRRIVHAVRVPALQYVVIVRIRDLVGWLVRRVRTFVADLLCRTCG